MSEPEHSDARDSLCLGLIGGLGVGATIHYYRALIDAHTSRGLSPRLLIAHAELNRVLQHVRDGRTVELAGYLPH